MQALVERMTTIVTETTKNFEEQLYLTFEIAIEALPYDERQFWLEVVTGSQK